jgi:ligand-binding sensor domain-containing protein
VLSIRAAIPWSLETVLLATNAGIREYDPAERTLATVRFQGPSRPVNAMTRDGLGRLWIGGQDGLWMIEVGGGEAEPFDRVPWVGRNAVSVLAPDPHHEDGIIVASGSRGVAFVRAKP